jgi:Polyketide cyclase / dehydrase and lipid transport
MATIRKVIDIDASAVQVWDVVRDVGAVHTRFAPGFVTNTVLEESARVVTFASGLVAREVIVGLDETLRRLAYSASGGRLTHHNASFEVTEPTPDRTRLVWTADVLPDAMKSLVESMMEAGSQAIVKAFSRTGG